jgi:PAS domain S-box-containing protein
MKMNKNTSLSSEVEKLTKERNLLVKLLEESNLKLEEKTRGFSLITRIGDIIENSFDIDSICRNFANIIIEETNAENCSLLLKDSNSEKLLLKVACGVRHKKPTFFEELKKSNVIFSVGEGIAGRVALKGETILINDVKNDKRFDHSRKSHIPIGSLICCPLVSLNKIFGVINMSSSQTHAFSQDDMRAITMFSTFVSSVFCNASTYNALKNSEDKLQKKAKELIKANKNLKKAYNELATTQEQLKMQIEERRLVEDNLRETKDHLSNLIESSIDCIMVSDRTGNISRVNKYFLDLLGYKEKEVIGKHVMECTPMMEEGIYECTTGEMLRIGKEFIEDANAMISHLINEGKATNWETYYFRKDKKVVPIEQNIVCLYDKKGERTGAVAVIRDITERKKTEKELRKTKEFLEKVIETTVDGIMICDTNGYITTVNTALEKLSGLNRDHLIGEHSSILISEDQEIRKKFRENTAKLFEQGTTVYESALKRSDGKHVEVEYTISLIKNETGDYIAGVAVLRDVSDRNKAERESRESKEFLEDIFKTSVDGMIITDHQGIITMVNVSAETILGYSRDELIGKSTSMLNPVGKHYEDHAMQYLTDLFAKGSVTAFEFTWLKKDGNSIDVEVNAALLKDTDDTITGSIASIRDITERKHHQEELNTAYEELETRVKERTAALNRSNKQLKSEIKERELIDKKLFEAKEIAEYASKAKSEFLANMSHEFRTPLNHIIGFTELVVDKNFGDLNETQDEYLNDVLDSSKHLLALINDILDLSKVEAGKMELALSDVNPTALAKNSLIMFKEKAFKHGIALSADVDSIPETITADARKLKQIIYNLLSNAMKFTPDGGQVRLSARIVDCIIRPGLRWGDPEDLQIIEDQINVDESAGAACKRCVEFSVSDTGVGIGKENQERIFTPFEQVDGSASRKYQGTGLGLSLTKKLVELHGGSIWVKSEGEGKGSTFSFSIPV